MRNLTDNAIGGESLEFHILGTLEVSDNGKMLDLGPFKQRALLALLLISANSVVSTDRILEELWGDEAEGKENALWVYISRLRSALEPDRSNRGESMVLLTREHGYTLSAEPSSVDALRFESAVEKSHPVMKDDPEAASEMLREALGLWRGPALEEFAYEEFAQREIGRLQELRLNALEDRIEADLRVGLAGELVSELEALHEEHPLRERPLGQLMLALYRAGRQAEALRVFERFRRGLGEEMGIDPSPELHRLEEQILLHDSRLRPLSERRSQVPSRAGAEVTNPFKGLRAFLEDDAADFFGRDRLVADVIRRIVDGERLIALVGPSGSGKSSAVRAGLLPALRKGAVPNSDQWLIAQMMPGARPFAEAEAALLRSTLDAPANLAEQMADADAGILRAALRVLPTDTSHLLLVIDQFEELFTLVEDEDERRRFIDNLMAAVDDAHGRVHVIVTLRADFYDRPLSYPEFGSRLGEGVINVVPLTPEELEAAAQQPALKNSVTLEPTLLAELIADVVGQPGALPMFQYTLTELFDRRAGTMLTAETYREMGGVRGALTKKADDLYGYLTSEQQAAAKQLFLRLVAISEHDHWSRRRVLASEIVALDVDIVAVQAVTELFGSHRLLTFDRDYISGSPTLEVAHEALLGEWERLREWIRDSRSDLDRRFALASALGDWQNADQNPDYLFAGSRLAEYEEWVAGTSLRLTIDEREYLDAAIETRDQGRATEQDRVSLQARTVRSAKRRLWGLAAALVVLGSVGVGFLVAALAPEPPTVAVVFLGPGVNSIDDLIVDGVRDAQRDFDFELEEIIPPFTDLEDTYRKLAESGTDLIIAIGDLAEPMSDVAFSYPDTSWAVLDWFVGPEVAHTSFAVEEGSFLVGAAAALASESGTIGFVGGFQFEAIERFRAGYEAGARTVDRDIEILANYVSAAGYGEGFGRDDLAKAAAVSQNQQGADVVFHAAGEAGFGVFQAAREQTTLEGKHLWAIGVDADQYQDVNSLLRRHILTSMVKKFDLYIYMTIKDFVEGNWVLTDRVLGLADEALDFSTSGGHLNAEDIVELNRLKQEIISGERLVPIAPTGPVGPPPEVEEFTVAVVTYDGARCHYDGPPAFPPGQAVRVDFVNATPTDAFVFVGSDVSFFPVLSFAARANGANSGFAQMAAGGAYSIFCMPELSNFDTAIEGALLTVASS